MSNLENFWCSEGYNCLEGVTVSNPEEERNDSDELIGHPCDQGYYCEIGIVHQQICQDGFYSNSTGDTVCSSCPSDYYCDNSQWTEGLQYTECVLNSTCYGGEKRQPICPFGTFFDEYAEEGKGACIDCGKGVFCRAGLVAGQCTGGYICDGGVIGDPNPAGNECDMGKFCPHGSTWQRSCPYFTLSFVRAAI